MAVYSGIGSPIWTILSCHSTGTSFFGAAIIPKKSQSSWRRTNDRESSPENPAERSVGQWLEQFHAAPPTFEDESLAPEVDREVLVSLVRRQLSREHARLVYQLVYSFQSWSDAHNEELIKEFRNRPK